MRQEEIRTTNNTSPLDSGGSTAESFTSDTMTASLGDVDTGSPRSVGHHTPNGMSPHSDRDSMSPQQGIPHPESKIDGQGDDDSFDLITCFCMKPFAGRPMIECSECLTWIHLSCAKIRKSNIPDEFICNRCRESKFTTRKSHRIRSEKKLVNA